MPKKFSKFRHYRSSLREKPTFFVRVLFCENSTWQGEVQWLQARRTRRFRSALELMALLDEAVDMSSVPGFSGARESWREDDEESADYDEIEAELPPTTSTGGEDEEEEDGERGWEAFGGGGHGWRRDETSEENGKK